MKLRKKGVAQFQLIARNPPALLIAGGILFYLLGDQSLARVLIFLGFVLQVFWLLRGFKF